MNTKNEGKIQRKETMQEAEENVFTKYYLIFKTMCL